MPPIGSQLVIWTDFWPIDQILIGVILPNPMHLQSLRANHTWLVKLLIKNSCFLQIQCDLDLWPLDPKINRGHLLVMYNHHTKFKVPRFKCSLVIDRKTFGLWTDRPTDRPTDKCKATYPLFFEGGHNYSCLSTCNICTPYLIADVANTWPLDPTANTTADAVTTRKSEIYKQTIHNHSLLIRYYK
jgi:hypothetical protein